LNIRKLILIALLCLKTCSTEVVRAGLIQAA